MNERLGPIPSNTNERRIAAPDAAVIETQVRTGSRALGGGATTLFLLSPDQKMLEGAILGWDWTRTSFPSELVYWPNVCDAIAHNRAVSIDGADARSHEVGWFERGGIHATVCVPMCAGDRVLGVLFFDDPQRRSPRDLAAAKSIADGCAELIARAA